MITVIFAQTTLYELKMERCLSAIFKNLVKVITFAKLLMASVLDSQLLFSSVFKVNVL